MDNYHDIKKSETKLIQDEKWRFDFRENGYVIVSVCSRDKEDKIYWRMVLHAVDLETCVKCVFEYYGGMKIIHYDELDDA